MRLPISWLKKYIDVKLTPEKLAEVLTLSGTAVESVHQEGNEAVLDIEVTTNRPDCLSILGLARELSALTGKKVIAPKILTALKNIKQKSFSRLSEPKIRVEDKMACPYYTARIIRNVTISSAPAEAQHFLTLMKSKPISNVVDATNFVLFEMGQPLHAFDYDKIAGGQVVIRRSKNGEKFIGIDGVEYTLDSKTLVIADSEKVIAIAGVMGGKLTEVTDSTKNLLIESAYFDLALVREASRKYKLTTESSYRFERGVCVENIALASQRACDLIGEWAKGETEGKLLEFNNFTKKKSSKIKISLATIDAILGLKISKARIITILKSLGFSIKAGGKDAVEVTVPAWRKDITLEADIAEEILRIEGFDKVPSQLPPNFSPLDAPQDKRMKGILSLKQFLSHQGFHEIVTYSLLSQKIIANSGVADFSKVSKIKNFVSAEQEYLRPSLMSGALQSIVFNLHRKANALKLFEVGNVFLDGIEKTSLGVAVCGLTDEHWQSKNEASFFYLKGAAESILSFLKIKHYVWEESSGNQFYNNQSILKVDGKLIGSLGCIHGQILKSWDILKEVYYFEMDLDRAVAGVLSGLSLKVKSIPKYPSVRRDLAFVINENIPVADCALFMKECAKPFLQEVQLFDEYTGKNIPQGKRSLAFSLSYQKDTGTFMDEEISDLQSKICSALKAKYQVEFR